MLQNATPLRKSAPWPPNSSHEHVSCTAPATRHASLRILFTCPTLAIVFGHATKPSSFAYSWQGAESIVPATRSHASTSKSGANMWCFWHLTSQCASRHNAVHFFDISTSKSGPTLRCFVNVDFEVSKCASRHNGVHYCDISTSKSAPNPFEKWSEHEVFCAFWLGNVLRATTACNFSSLIRPDGSAPEPQIIEKALWFATFLPFPAPASSFFDSFSSLIFSLDCKPLPKPLLLYFGKNFFPYHFPSTSHIFPCYVALFCQYFSHVQDYGGAPVLWLATHSSVSDMRDDNPMMIFWYSHRLNIYICLSLSHHESWFYGPNFSY